MKLCTVYGLCSSADGKIRYVGQTVQRLDHRLAQHLSEARRNAKNYRTCWIKSVFDSGHEILIFEIETHAVWNRAEQRLIAFYRKHGAELVNLTKGGEGTIGQRFPNRKGRRPDLAARNRLGKGKPGHPSTPETNEKIRQAHLGRKCPWLSERNRLMRGKPGHKHTPESKAKIAAFNKGRKHRPESIAKMRAAKLGKQLSPETKAKMSASQRKRYASIRA